MIDADTITLDPYDRVGVRVAGREADIERLAVRDVLTDIDTEADTDGLALKHVTCKSNTLVPPHGKPNIVWGVLKVHDGNPRHVVLDNEPDVAALQEPTVKLPHVPVGLP